MSPARRYAIVRGYNLTASRVAAYLPGNYRVEGELSEATDLFSSVHPAGFKRDGERLVVVISGVDEAGWTFESYVSPRLGSGNMAAQEIDLSHPAMKSIPLDGHLEYA